MRHEMLTQRAPFCIGAMAKKGTLSQHFVTHVVPPLGYEATSHSDLVSGLRNPGLGGTVGRFLCWSSGSGVRSSSSGVSCPDREGWVGGMHPKAPNCAWSPPQCEITYRHTGEESTQAASIALQPIRLEFCWKLHKGRGKYCLFALDYVEGGALCAPFNDYNRMS